MADPRLLETYLRMTPEEARRRESEQLRDWFEKQQEIRQSKLGESLGLGDLALLAKPATTAGAFGADVLNRLLSVPPNEEYMQGVVPKATKLLRNEALAAAKAAGKSGPRTPYHDFLDKQEKLIAASPFAQPWQKQNSSLRQGEIPVVRAARQPSPPSDRRLGGFYNVRTPTTSNPGSNKWYSANQDESGLGGSTLFGATARPRNPYVRVDDAKVSLPGGWKGGVTLESPDQTSRLLRGPKEFELIEDIAKANNPRFAEKNLGKYGLNRKEVRHIWESEEGPWSRRDAILSKILQKEGFDALVETRNAKKSIQTGPELFKLREPRHNFSYDRFPDSPRGLSDVHILRAPEYEGIRPSILDEFAKGRSPALGRLGQKAKSAGASKTPSQSLLQKLLEETEKHGPDWTPF